MSLRAVICSSQFKAASCGRRPLSMIPSQSLTSARLATRPHPQQRTFFAGRSDPSSMLEGQSQFTPGEDVALDFTAWMWGSALVLAPIMAQRYAENKSEACDSDAKQITTKSYGQGSQKGQQQDPSYGVRVARQQQHHSSFSATNNGPTRNSP